jgi:putative tryptophan/tyrosine transport system substrate-binding protein
MTAQFLYRRRTFLTLAGAWLARPCGAKAEQPRGQVGHLFIGPANASRPYRDAFVAGLRALGYEIGVTLIYHERYADGDPARVPALIDELIALKPTVLVAVGYTARLMMAKTPIPIVMSNAFDPVDTGLVKSLARPGGTVTGVANFGPTLVAKQIELLSEIVPGLRRIAVVNDSSMRLVPAYEQVAEQAARSKGATTISLFADDQAAVIAAFARLEREGANALVVGASNLYFSFRNSFVAEAQRLRLPAIYPYEAFVRAGGLISYNGSVREGFRRAATFVDKILKGANPADLPVEQPTKFELIINLTTAKALGLEVPPTHIARADEVIE